MVKEKYKKLLESINILLEYEKEHKIKLSNRRCRQLHKKIEEKLTEEQKVDLEDRVIRLEKEINKLSHMLKEFKVVKE